MFVRLIICCIFGVVEVVRGGREIVKVVSWGFESLLLEIWDDGFYFSWWFY